jgi:hypothetical protein
MPIFTALASMPRHISFWPFITVILLIFWLSVIKAPSLRVSEHWLWDHIDKIGHALAYAALSFSACTAFRQYSEKKQISRKLIWRIAIFSFTYGFSIEILQYFLPHRSFDPLDLLANAVGILGAVGFFAGLYSKSFGFFK